MNANTSLVNMNFSLGKQPSPYVRHVHVESVPKLRIEQGRWHVGFALLFSVGVGFLVWIFSPTLSEVMAPGTMALLPVFAFTPGLLLVMFGARPLVVARAKRGTNRATGTIIAADDSGHAVNYDAQQRALVHVEHEGQTFLMVAPQYGLGVYPGQEVHVRFAGTNPRACYIESAQFPPTAPEIDRTDTEHTGIERTNAEVLAEFQEMRRQLDSVAAGINRLDEEASQAPIAVDEFGRPIQALGVENLQRTGAHGTAHVQSVKYLGESDQARSFYLELVVHPADGSPKFEAGMRFRIRHTSPAKVQQLASQGARFDVRFDPTFTKHVVIATHELAN